MPHPCVDLEICHNLRLTMMQNRSPELLVTVQSHTAPSVMYLCLAVVRAYVGAVNANNLSYLEPGKLPFRASEAAHFHTCENFARPRVCKGSVGDVHSAEKVCQFQIFKPTNSSKVSSS